MRMVRSLFSLSVHEVGITIFLGSVTTVTESRGGMNVINVALCYQTFTFAGELEAAVVTAEALLLQGAVVGRLTGAGVTFQRER